MDMVKGIMMLVNVAPGRADIELMRVGIVDIEKGDINGRGGF